MYAIVKILIPIWAFGGILLSFVALSHLIFSFFQKNENEDDRWGLFGLRLFCAVFWPLILVSIPGRKFIFLSVKGLFRKGSV